MAILDPSKTEKELEKLTDELKKIFQDNGLEFVEEDVWGVRELAYKIRQWKSGYYSVMNFEGEGESVPKIHEELRLMSQTGVIRYMLIKMPEDYALMRYDKKDSEKAAKLSDHAEELQKKVTRSAAKKKTAPEPEPEVEEPEEVVEAPEEPAEEPAEEPVMAKEEASEPEEEKPKEKETSDLDEKLQAIIDDTDIDL